MTASSGRPVVVVGAGFAGLTAAAELRRRDIPVVVLEGGRSVGGMARSFHDQDGFTFDFGAHFITNRLAATLGLGAECRTVERYRESVWLDGKTYTYPFGLVREPRFALEALRTRLVPRRAAGPGASARDVFVDRYGNALTDAVAAPLLEAWSGARAEELAPSVADKVDTSVPMTMWLRAAGKLSQRAVAIGYCRELPESAAVWHVYPERGVGRLVESLAAEVHDAIRLESPVDAIVVENEAAVAVRVHGELIPAGAVFTSAPLHVLPKLVEGTSALDDLVEFRYRPMVFANLKLEGRTLLPDVVTWTPGAEFPFFRLTEAPMAMPWLAPEGKTVITADLGCEVGDHVWNMTESELTEFIFDGLERIVPDIRKRHLASSVMRTPLAYPVFLASYEDRRRELASKFPISGLMPIGRNGEFDHLLMEDVYWRTRRRVAAFASV